MIQRTKNRNKPGGNSQNMLEFNALISQIGVLEIPLKGQSFTWTKKQQQPLLEKLDWCFVSHDRSIHYPWTCVHTLAHDVSDHVLWIVQVNTRLPKLLVFRFEITGYSMKSL
jgi:endonuclease/exonuclease/phosphatase family metal-dependent hydrolase